jgi:selenium metabolism protein YedF
LNIRTIDCRGLACPQPVIETKKVIDSGSEKDILVIVDNAVARENVSRLAKRAGCSVNVKEQEGLFHLEITVPDSKITTTAPGPEKIHGNSETAGNVYFITTNSIGQGSPDLGEALMKSLMVTLAQQTPPAALLFLNTGVHLAIEGSPVLEQLQAMAGRGTEMLVCGTCMNYYKISEKLAVGTVSNMLEINSWLTGPYKVIAIG